MISDWVMIYSDIFVIIFFFVHITYFCPKVKFHTAFLTLWGQIRTVVYNTRQLNAAEFKQMTIDAWNNDSCEELQIFTNALYAKFTYVLNLMDRILKVLGELLILIVFLVF